MCAKPFAAVLCLLFSSACSHHKTTDPKLIVLGVDGMDPSFVERHWDALPNLRALRDTGFFGRLATTTPPQSPVAWSTFITGLEPDQHGLYDFVYRDPITMLPFSSMSRTEEPKAVLPLGPYLLPLSPARISSLRHGTPFWQTLSNRGVPVIVQRMPTNYPPVVAGSGLSGMGTPDLIGTQGTFTLFTDDPTELARSIPGGQIEKTTVTNGRALLHLPGPANPLRKDHTPTQTSITLDVDSTNPVARLKLSDQTIMLREGEWSTWLPVKFDFIPHISSVSGMVRIFAKQLHPGLNIYVSPINLDPAVPALPISTPPSYGSRVESQIGPYFTLGIPEDTAALRQSVLNLSQFQQQAQLVLNEETKLLNVSLDQFESGLLFFYFSSIDQNSHVLWSKHEPELLKIYQVIDRSVAAVRRRHPDAELIILSDHGFTTFERAVHLNTWLNQRGFLNLKSSPGPLTGLDDIEWDSTEAYALGLNGLYLNRKGRERNGIVTSGAHATALLENLRNQLLAWRDPLNGQAIVKTVTETHPSPSSSNVAPDLIVGYAPGYRASWQTGLGGIPLALIDHNDDAWIGDHCINASDVPGVLFRSQRIKTPETKLQGVTMAILDRFGLAGESQ